LTENQPVQLRHFEQVGGILYKLKFDQGKLIVSIGKVLIALPMELELHLRPLIGHRITILRTNIVGKEFLVRIIGQELPVMEKRPP
jgi:hypothetical protein